MNEGELVTDEQRWGSYDYNIYYNSAACGLELLAELDDDLAWEYNTTLLFRYEGKLYIAQDSGCSCPTPFEEFHSISDLVHVTSRKEVARLIDDRHQGKSAEDRATFLGAVDRAFSATV